MDSDVFDKALEKLWIHEGTVLDSAENVTAGERQWRELYIAHREQKLAQIKKMLRFADTNQCRMSTLVRHLGDLADGHTACGICDFWNTVLMRWCSLQVGGLPARRLSVFVKILWTSCQLDAPIPDPDNRPMSRIIG